MPAYRILDTRSGTGAISQGPVSAGNEVSLRVTGAGGVRAFDVSAVVLTVTVTQPTAPGTVTVFADGSPMPGTSNVNYVKGQTVANLVVTAVGADGKVDLRVNGTGTVQLIADVSGYYLAGAPTSPGSFVPITPARLLDTRSGNGAPKHAVAAGQSIAVQIAGRGAVPASNVSAVVLTVTVTQPTAPGTVTVFADGSPMPGTSNVNYVKGQTVANLVVTAVGADGKVDLRVNGTGTVQLIADVSGYYLPNALSTVYAWGNNSQGGLGNGTYDSSEYPQSVWTQSGVTSVAADYFGGHLLAADGTVWSWGRDDSGTFGDGTQQSSTTPVEAAGLTHVTAIASAQTTGYALRSDGTVWAFGSDNLGQLGDGTVARDGCYCSLTPVQVSGLTDVTAIAGGADQGFALRADGTVWAWGHDSGGALGDGTVGAPDCDCRANPVQVSNISNVTAIAAGGVMGYALESNGSVWAWGCCGPALGQPSGTDAKTPVPVPGLSGVTHIAGSGRDGYAIDSTGALWVWGFNTYGEIGDGSTTDTSNPVKVASLPTTASVAAGADSAYATEADGTTWAWGNNAYAQLGVGPATTTGCECIPSPVQLTGLRNVSLIASAGLTTFALAGPS